MKLVGFLNLGNTCYINSVLQCFIYDELFQKTLQGSNILYDIIKHIDLNENSENLNIPYNLKKFIDYFISKKTWFKRYQQNDAHEFLTNFIDLLCNNISFPIPNHSDKSADSLWNSFLINNNSESTRVYHGQLQTIVKCCKCNNNSITYEEFNTINLDVNTSGNLTDFFMEYLKKESINDYYCDCCQCNVLSEKKTSLYRIPDRLIIVLKKYSIKYKVQLEKLIIKESISGSIKNCKLTGIVSHTGNLHDGHYTTNVLVNDNWYFIDDHNIFLNDSINLNDPDAYILFYNLSTPSFTK